MRISCVIPTKDRRDMVALAIESALGQEGGAPEVIVVDDGSCDGTAEAVRRRFPEVRLVTTPGLGPGPARNAGVAEASGDFILFLDSDDRWTPDHVAALSALFEEGFEVAYGVTRTTSALGEAPFLIPDRGRGVSGACFRALSRWCFLVPSALGVSRAAFAHAGGFGASPFGEDWLFVLRLSRHYPFGFAPKIITERLLHQGSLCCLDGQTDQLGGLLEEIVELVADSPDGHPEDLDRIRAIEELTKKRTNSWPTVQEWYLELKAAGFV